MSSAQTHSPGFSSPTTLAEADLVEPTHGAVPNLPASLWERHRGSGGFDGAAAKRAREPGPAQRLLQRATMGWTLGEQQRIDEIGYDAYLEEQLDYNSIDDSELENALAAAYPSLARDSEGALRFGGGAASQLLQATLLRATYSPRQLFERMVVFWSDHFNIDLRIGRGYALKLIDDRDVIRRHAMGRFPDLLFASGHSPAMLEYLTNDTNTVRHPNENYGREVMELHTLGADNGYDQQDVREVSRCFTGWGLWDFNVRGEKAGSFHFKSVQHDRDDKVVLGHAIPGSKDVADGEAVLEILAYHPNTAGIVAQKLLRYFWGYEPPTQMIQRVAKTYINTGGNIRSMLRVILRQAYIATATPKLKRPFHLLVSALRALGAQVTDPRPLLDGLIAAGHLPFTWPMPDGFPDTLEYWVGYLLPRWEFTPRIIRPDYGVRIDLPALDPEVNPALTREQVRARLDRQLLGRTMSGATKTALQQFLDGGELTAERVDEAIGLALSSPDFQMY